MLCFSVDSNAKIERGRCTAKNGAATSAVELVNGKKRFNYSEIANENH